MTLACHGVVTTGMEKSSRILSTCLSVYLPICLCIYGSIRPSTIIIIYSTLHKIHLLSSLVHQ